MSHFGNPESALKSFHEKTTCFSLGRQNMPPTQRQLASIVPGGHKLQGGVLFITRVVQLLHAPHALVLQYHEA
jgi:hypothetical protein